MILARVRDWFQRAKPVRTRTHFPALAGRDPHQPLEMTTAFLIVREVGDRLEDVYEGDNGVEALETWEACQIAGPPGTYSFLDRHHGVRGRFSR